MYSYVKHDIMKDFISLIIIYIICIDNIFTNYLNYENKKIKRIPHNAQKNWFIILILNSKFNNETYFL